MDSHSDKDEISSLMERYAERKKHGTKYRPLKLRVKKPGLSQILGDENPMKSEELEEIKKYLKLSR